MEVFPPSIKSIQRACDVLQSGGVVAHATETCYGLACDLSNINAVKKLFLVKSRPENLLVSALFASIDQAKEYLEWNTTAERLVAKYLPGPLTIILPLKSNAPYVLFPAPYSQHPNPSVGLRLSPHPTASALVKAFGRPLSTTSANLHGHPNPYNAEAVAEQINPDIILDDGILEQKDASTVLDLTKGKLMVVRQGALEIEM